MRNGSLALILHAHLPFVRHPEHEEFLEESWLFEAITESYIPLIKMMQQLVTEGVPFRIAMSITPPLCAMLQDELLRERYVQHLDRSIALAQRELERTQADLELHQLAHFYCELLTDTRQRFEDWNRDLLCRLRELRDAGVLEIAASAATHGLLPLLGQSPQAVRAQVMLGCDVYRETFEAEPAGFWLPECAFAPGLEDVLQAANIRWFAVDAHALLFAKPRPRAAIFAPCFTPAGPAAFARDPASSRQVWSAESGYPGDPAYRDFYRDVGFDAPPQHAFANSLDKTPRFTGLKYHRITGGDGPKQVYNRTRAEEIVQAHAEHFVASREHQLNDLRSSVHDPVIMMPFDAELFGHWWHEGPRFLELLIRKVAAGPDRMSFVTPSDYLASHARLEVTMPAASSWGENGYWEVWLNEHNAWIYPRLHSAARTLTELARAHAASPSPQVERVLRQLARELLLGQSSDWAFLMKTGTAREYASRRVDDHMTRFEHLAEQLKSGAIDQGFLCECEARDNLFPHVDWRRYV
ncbi:MAG TPA: 1,4-alpha-glucan branching protein domain-containing protein [Chthoniobacterales bacterium]